MPAPIRLYSTLSKSVEPFKPIKEGHVGLYVCGMTVYDKCHVGHARAMVIFDSFVKYLRYRGWAVTFVRNFTDIDDKIIHRALALGEEPAALAQRYIDEFHQDTDALGLVRPDFEPRVSESIDEILSMIGTLVEKGHAYAAEGSVWFDVTSSPSYGKLSGQKLDGLKSADAVGGKRHPADFALWKAVKPDEPNWPSPWGDGRPGWHIECSAMAEKVLGNTFDIHGGGLDLVFPHHENEIAQSECASGHTFANYWMHNGLLTMTSGQKMGKSLGNVTNIDEVLKGFPAESVRLYYLQSQYRSSLPWGEDALPDALAMLSRLYEAKEVAQGMKGEEPAAEVAASLGGDATTVLNLGASFQERFIAALDDDFNSAQALGLLFEFARALNRFSGHKKARKRGGTLAALYLDACALVHDALGLLGDDVDSFMEVVKEKRLGAMGLCRDDVEALLRDRALARTNKAWAEADEIRTKLDSLGIVVMDRPDGAIWRVSISS